MRFDVPFFKLFGVSALVLILELAWIRWFPAHVLYLTFFTNGVMLAAFVGMSIGCLLAERPVRLIGSTPLLVAVALGMGMFAEAFQSKIAYYTSVANQEKQPEVVFYGAEANAQRTLEFAIPAELLFAVYFVLIAATLIGPGQEMGRAFNNVTHRLSAYTANLAGSLVGIGLFALWSTLWIPPVVWFAVIGAGLLTLVWPMKEKRVAAGIFAVIMVVASFRTSGIFPEKGPDGTSILQTWSPYYRIKYEEIHRLITTNQIGHQAIQSTKTASYEPYALPYLLNRELRKEDGSKAWPEFKRVLIIGAGSGNDVARACQWIGHDAKIDAVDIDPVIQNLGMTYHDDQPYADPRVTRINNDGRNFLRKAPSAEYDLVVFALIDSLVLTSGYSNLRLESYLYTDESFADVRRVLKPDGICTLYNFFRRAFVTRRLNDGLQKAFGVAPVLFTNPPVDKIVSDGQDAGFSMFYAGSANVIEPLRGAFKDGRCFWYPNTPIEPATPARFGLRNDPPSGDDYWIRFRIPELEPIEDLRPATDDWPFLYNRKPMIPSHNITGMLIMLLISGLLYVVAERYAGRPTTVDTRDMEWGPLARSFLLGAGFMLIETKAVVQMSLLFGSTWTVNTVVFAAILAMSLLGSAYAAIVKPQRLTIYYILLFASLVVNVAVSPASAFANWSTTAATIATCLLSFAPVTFAGVIFAGSFARTARPDRFFAANVAGALIGGLAENLSMLLGFQLLGVVAFAFYGLSAWAGRRR
jgi:hypothetical protein